MATFENPSWSHKFLENPGFTPNGFIGLIAAMGLTYVAFEGYDIIVQSGEEIKSPATTIPKAIFYSLAVVVPIYGLKAEKEIELGIDPLKTDTDGDGALDKREIELSLEPNAKDTDEDGFENGEDIYPNNDAKIQVTIDYYKKMSGLDIASAGDIYFTISINGHDLKSKTITGKEIYFPHSSIRNVPDDIRKHLVKIIVMDTDTLSSDDHVDIHESIKEKNIEINYDIQKKIEKVLKWM